MSYLNINNTETIIYSSIPSRWIVEDYIIENYNSMGEQRFYEDGFRQLVYPQYNTQSQKLGEIYFDTPNDVFTYEVLNKTQQEIQSEILAAAQAAQDEALMAIKNSKILAEIQEFEDEDALQNQAAFPFWEAGIYVSLGEKRQHFNAFNELKLYKCIQAHETLENWQPKDTPALWVEVAPPGVIPVWVQPQGAHDAYQIDDLVHFPTESDPVYRNTVANNVYAPDVYGWVLND